MQYLHLLCPREQTFPLEQSFKDQFMDQDAFGVVDVGFVEKQPVGLVVLMAREHFNEEFLAQVHADPDVTGYSLFSQLDDDTLLRPTCALSSPSPNATRDRTGSAPRCLT